MTFRILLCIIALAVAGGASGGQINVADTGAIGDGVFDNTDVFQKALDQASAAGGGVVDVPAGRFRINGNLVIPAGVTLQGTYRTAPNVGVDGLKNPLGSTLLAYAGRGSAEGKPFIELGGESATLAGFIIIYPEWKKEDVPPVPYPPCVATNFTQNVAILDCNIVNAYEAIRLIRGARHLVRNVHGYPSWRGLYVDQIYDIGRIENVHFSPFGTNYKADDPYNKWINLNGVAFEFARTDWQYVTNLFCFGYGVGYKFSESEFGPCNGSFMSIGADSCRRAVLVEQASDAGLLITNGEFVGRWGGDDSVCVEIGPNAKAKVSITNSSFWGPNDKCIWLRSPDAQLTAVACNFLNWDWNMMDSPAIDVETGKAIIQGNTFRQGSIHVRVGKDTTSAIIIWNQAENGLLVENHAGDRTQTLLNQQPPVILSQSAKEHYTVDVGGKNDSQFLRHWSYPEDAHDWDSGTKRWSSKTSKFTLPVIPGRPYQVTLDVNIREYALEPGGGLYLGDLQVIKFEKTGTMLLTGTIPAVETDEIILEVRCKPWIPQESIPGSGDGRTLGVAVRSITLRADGAASDTPHAAN